MRLPNMLPPANMNASAAPFVVNAALPSSRNPPTVLLLAHGAGAPMDSPFLETVARLVAARGVTVARFEFAYMAERRAGGRKRPPPKADILCAEYLAAVARLKREVAEASGRLLIGGKSMGGRMASLVAQDLYGAGQIAGLVCLGYPFHPAGKPTTLRTAHLADLTCPALVVQGEDDPLGTRAQVAGYALSPSIGLHWIAGGDHDLVAKAGTGPVKSTKEQRQQAGWTAAADAIAGFANRHG